MTCNCRATATVHRFIQRRLLQDAKDRKKKQKNFKWGWGEVVMLKGTFWCCQYSLVSLTCQNEGLIYLSNPLQHLHCSVGFMLAVDGWSRNLTCYGAAFCLFVYAILLYYNAPLDRLAAEQQGKIYVLWYSSFTSKMKDAAK